MYMKNGTKIYNDVSFVWLYNLKQMCIIMKQYYIIYLYNETIYLFNMQ